MTRSLYFSVIFKTPNHFRGHSNLLSGADNVVRSRYAAMCSAFGVTQPYGKISALTFIQDFGEKSSRCSKLYCCRSYRVNLPTIGRATLQCAVFVQFANSIPSSRSDSNRCSSKQIRPLYYSPTHDLFVPYLH